MTFEVPMSRISRFRIAAAATAAAACTVLAIGVAPALATTTDLTDVHINEVESNGDAGHVAWIELYNTGPVNHDDVDLSGAYLSDDTDSHQLVIPDGTFLGV